MPSAFFMVSRIPFWTVLELFFGAGGISGYPWHSIFNLTTYPMAMNMNIKSKLYAGIGLLAGCVLILWISSSIFINTLADNSGAIIRDNIRSVTYAQQMEQAVNDLFTARGGSEVPGDGSFDRKVAAVEQVLERQQQNITETGERELTNHIADNFDNLVGLLRSGSGGGEQPRASLAYHRLQQNLSQLTTMNLDAIHRKNTIAQNTASQVTLYMSLIGALCFILGVLMLLRFPGYIVSPIQELIRRIKDISDRNYDQTLEFHTGDEYEELADAFNRMAAKLQEYENSSIDRVMSEKKRVETIINHMSDAVLGLDAGNYILYANEKAMELTGTDRAALIGRYGPDVASDNDLFHKVMKAVTEKTQETGYIKVGDTNEDYYAIEVIPVQPEPGEDEERTTPLGNLVILKNVTRFHELDQAKTNFVSVVSHELKTPISSIAMSLRLLGDERIGPMNREQKELVGKVKDDLQRMKKTTTDLLDLTKIESGNISLNVEKVQPAQLIGYAYETMLMQASQKKLTIEQQVEAELPAIHADAQKTVWVLVNLISNAIRYTDAGGTILLEAHHGPDPAYVQFVVEDTGRGIEAGDLEKIFDKYYQVKVPDRGGSDRGSGLGLSIAREFIRAQGGSIRAESEPGQGSRFIFQLPINEYHA